MLRNLLVLTILSTVASANTLPFILTDGAETPQRTTGSVQGQVTDPSGAAVAGASVVLVNSITNYKVATQTDDTGAFRFQNVPYNSYKLTVSAPEFQKSAATA